MKLKIVPQTLLSLITLAIIVPTAQAQQSTTPSPQERAGINIRSLNRNQQAIYLETGKFTNKFRDLRIDLSNTNPNYRYVLLPSRTSTLQYAIARRRDLKSHVGQVAVIRHSNGGATTKAIVCENDQPGILRPASPLIDTNLKLICAPGTTKFKPSYSFPPEQWNGTGRTIAALMTRSQQAYYLENMKFAKTVEELELGLDEDDYPSHEFSIQANDRVAYQYAISRLDGAKSYVGVAMLGFSPVFQEDTTFGLVCENLVPGRLRPAAPIIVGDNVSPVCAPGTQAVR